MNTNHYLKGLMITAAGATGWGISGVCGQYLFMHYTVNTEWLTAIRMLLSGILLLAAAYPKNRNRVFGIWRSGRDVGWLLAFALIGLLMCQYTFLGAIKYANSATATVLQSLNVIIMAVVMAIWTRTRMSRIQVISIILALAGTYLIATGGSLTRMKLSTMGLILGLLAAVGVVTYTLLSRPIMGTWGNMIVTGWGMLIGGAVLTVGTRAWHIPAGLDATAWLMIAIIIVIGTAIAFAAFLEGIKYIGPQRGMIVGCMEPASATVLSALFLGTRFSIFELIGFCCIIATVILAAVKKPE